MDSTGKFLDDKSLVSAAATNLSNLSVELCLVCGDRASGRHYGAISCEGCKGFFKRSIRKQLGYQCRGTMNCEVTKHHRNRCQFCRLQKCLASGMRSDSVQHERKPIIDKKELQNSINNSTNSPNNTAGIYHHRSKMQNHQSVSIGSPGNATTDNLATILPVGFNFADLTQTLGKRALLAVAPYQQQDNFSCSPGTQTNDDDSMDNSVPGPAVNTGGGLSQDNLTTSNACASVTAAAANLIQSSLDKHLITQSIDLIVFIQQQYDRSSIINNNNSNSIVKDELIIDDQQHRDLNDVDGETEQMIFDLPILPEQNVNFNLQTPTLVPSYLNLHYVCESGSRLLFLSVYWIKKIRAFQQLSEDIQVKLLRRHWVELFAIGLSQCSRTLSMSTIMSTLISNVVQVSEMDKVQANKIRKLSEHTYQLHEFVQSLQAMELNEHEYAYMRLIMVFSVNNLSIKNQAKKSSIERLQEYTLTSLRNYLRDTNHSDYINRCNKLLLKLMPLCALESDIIEELFFSSLIGQVQIENMIPYILKLGGGGV